MTDNRNITWEESDDPSACNTNETVYMLYTRDPSRTPFQWDDTDWAGFSSTNNRTWLPVHPNYRELNLKAQKEADKSTFKLYQNLIKLRKESHVLQVGSYTPEAINENLFAFTRTLEGFDTLAVFVNLGEETSANLRDLITPEDLPPNAKARILIVNNNSTLVPGNSIQNIESIPLGKYDAIVLEVSSATKLAISTLLVISCLIKTLVH